MESGSQPGYDKASGDCVLSDGQRDSLASPLIPATSKGSCNQGDQHLSPRTHASKPAHSPQTLDSSKVAWAQHATLEASELVVVINYTLDMSAQVF